MPLRSWIFGSSAGRSAILIRLLAGLVFVPEGLKKFLFAEQWGAGRFAKIGIPAPEVMASFVGAVELACGLLLLVGLATRLAAIPLAIDMCVALATTKLPLLWTPTALSSTVGFWSMQAESRTDFVMVMALVFLVAAGAGPWSLDARLARRRGANGG